MNEISLRRLFGCLLISTAVLATTVSLPGCGGGGGGGNGSGSGGGSVALPPAAPTVSVTTGGTLYQGNAISMGATASDPAGLSVTYSWNFGDGSASANGSTTSHSYASAGTYTVVVTATNSAGLSSTGNTSVTVASAAPTALDINPSTTLPISNSTVSFVASANDPQSKALTYTWSFGDGATGVGSAVKHSFASANTYPVVLTATNSSGYASTKSLSLTVVPLPATNVLVADCAGANCGATGAGTYSGSGLGVWRYTNTSGASATINVSVSMPGTSVGRTATLVFTNGGTTTLAASPSVGLRADLLDGLVTSEQRPSVPPAFAQAALSRQLPEDAHDALHSHMLEANQALSRELGRMPRWFTQSTTSTSLDKTVAPRMALSGSRTWVDLNSTNTPYSTNSQTSCSLPSGRQVVFWVDPNAVAAGNVTASNVTSMANAVCGSTGGFAYLNSLLGDFWGSHPYASSLIQDATGALQDVNIAIVNAPSSTAWAGYFYGLNNFRKTAGCSNCADSNEALVYFINASAIKTDLNFVTSTLLHEATHMVNFYQRSVQLDTSYDTWMEETSAMMLEDIVTPRVLSGYQKIPTRIQGYLASGGAVSYINWPTSGIGSSGFYGIGGAFGAYLNRIYGVGLIQTLATTCTSANGYATSYACVDAVIKSKGGSGFAGDFARFGASVFSLLPASGMPQGYGYPSRTDSGYALQPIDVNSFGGYYISFVPKMLTAGYTATTHTYQVDGIPAGDTSYKRNGIVVPAGSTFMLTIR